jgi:hypothetical protein
MTIPNYIHPPISKKLLKEELTKERFIRLTKKLNNEIYVVNSHNSPNVLKEIGRLREVTFAASGGGTKKELDLDHYDTDENCYDQLIVWSPEEEEIIGGYRFIDCSVFKSEDEIKLSTQNYFEFSELFTKEYLPFTIELGRSWIRPEYQPNINPKKGIFALDNLWDGLGALVKNYPHIKYLFGKVTMYSGYTIEAKDGLLHFMNQYFPDNQNLVVPKLPLSEKSNIDDFKKEIQNEDFKKSYRLLKAFVRKHGELVPPLINNYMQLSDTMKTFGTALNPDFGNVEETGILITIADIKEDTLTRYTSF